MGPKQQLRLFSRRFTPAEARAYLEARGILEDDRIRLHDGRKWRIRRGRVVIYVKRDELADVEQAQRVLRAERALADLSPEDREAFSLGRTGTDPK